MDDTSEFARRLLEQRAWLRQLAAHLVNAGEADDLAQATYVAALEHPRADVQEVRSWLAAIARNLARGLRRGGGRRERRERDAARDEALPSTTDLVERIDTGRALAQALLALREPYRTTLMLRFHEGLSAEEIARRQGVAAGTVRWRTNQGLAELRAKLEATFGGRDAFGVALVGLLGNPAGIASVPVGISAAKLALLGAAGVVLIGGAYWSAHATREGEPPAMLPALLASPQAATTTAAVSPASAPGALMPAAAGSDREPMTASLTRLRVLESDRQPNAGQLAALWTSDETGEPQCATIDADGWVAFPASGETLELAIQRESALPHRAALELVEGEQTIVLPQGAELRGWVEVEGHAPLEPLELTLVPAGVEVRRLAGDARELFLPCVQTRTLANGTFRLGGLEPRTYDLRLPGGFALLGKRAYSDPQQALVLHLDGPTSALRIELERHVTVRGRVLAADGVTPVSKAQVMVRAFQSNGDSRGNSVFTADDGRFVQFFGEFPSQVLVEYERTGGLGAARAERTLPEPELEIDFGDLYLDAGRSFTVRVLDSTQAPIAGAITDGGGPTDARGEVRIEGLGRAQAELWVGAAGYVPCRIELGEDPPDPLLVILESANELSILVRDSSGAALAGVGVELRGPADLLFASAPPRAIQKTMYESSSTCLGLEGCALDLKADQAGHITLRGLRPDREFDLCVVDSNRTQIERVVVVTPPAAERRSLELVVDEDLRAFQGRVTDTTGAGVPRAQVLLEALEPRPQPRFAASMHFGLSTTRTQNDGSFSLPRVHPGSFRLRVRKEGCADLVREPYELPDGEAEFVLEAGRTCVVRVADPGGQAVAGGELFRSVPGGALEAVPASGPGLFELSDLGEEPLALELRIGGLRLQESIEPAEAEHVFSVPAMGAVEASWSVAPGEDLGYSAMRLLSTIPGRLPLDEEVGAARSGHHRFEPVPAGTYQAELVRWEPTGEPDTYRAVTLLGPVEVSVIAGETVEVVLGL